MKYLVFICGFLILVGDAILLCVMGDKVQTELVVFGAVISLFVFGWGVQIHNDESKLREYEEKENEG